MKVLFHMLGKPSRESKLFPEEMTNTVTFNEWILNKRGQGERPLLVVSTKLS